MLIIGLMVIRYIRLQDVNKEIPRLGDFFIFLNIIGRMSYP